jgi:hypothetical protein
MKIKVNEQEIFELTEIQKQVIKNDIDEDIFDDDMKRRLRWVLEHKYERCFERLKREWEPKLTAKGMTSIPTNKDSFAQLVFQQAEYKTQKQKKQAAANLI